MPTSSAHIEATALARATTPPRAAIGVEVVGVGMGEGTVDRPDRATPSGPTTPTGAVAGER